MGKIARALDKALTETETDKAPARVRPLDPPRETAQPRRPERSFPQAERGHEDVTQGPVDPKLVVFHEPDSVATEHFKVVRSHILYPRDDRERRIILVTSALQEEGKTFVACNLAVSIAQGVDPYALLIDGDLRKPSVHRMLGLPEGGGLSDYLRGEAPLERYLIKTPLTKLTVLTAGRSVRNPAELLTSSKMAQLLREARDRYPDRYIIVDSPPIHLAAETLSLAQEAEGVIFVIRYGASNRDLVQQALEKVGRDKVVGVVFNDFVVPPLSYSYYSRKGYRYKDKNRTSGS